MIRGINALWDQCLLDVYMIRGINAPRMKTPDSKAPFTYLTYPWNEALYTYCSPFSAIRRSLIPRYFRSMFEGGISDLYYVLKYCKESFQNTCIMLDCEQAIMVTIHSGPVVTKVWHTHTSCNNQDINFLLKDDQWSC